MLQFTVIAGPNGAGKSTFSARMSHPDALIFDPDKEKFSIEKQYPDISEEALESAVTHQYDQFEMRSIAQQKHLTMETNLRNQFVAERANFFRKNGYETRLLYLLLPNVESSMDRVNFRVKNKGHFIDAESIRFNYETGLKNLVKVAPYFDHVILASGEGSHEMVSVPKLWLTARKGVIAYRSDDIPAWGSALLEDILKTLNL